MPKTQTAPTTGRLDVPGATLHYETRGSGPTLVLHAAPMDAASFAPAADLLAADYLVVTSDPRGINRSSVQDPGQEATPDQRADDLARLLEHLDAGPAAVIGSSGGAVSALALAQSRPDLVHTVVAHEPPLAVLLDDRDEIRVATERCVATYLAGDRRGYWQQFLQIADIHVPDDVFEMFFAGPLEGREAADELFAVERMEMATTFWNPDLAALRKASARVVVGVGEDSAGELCDRASRALASALGVEPTMFPGGHIAFVDDPTAFAERAREVLRG